MNTADAATLSVHGKGGVVYLLSRLLLTVIIDHSSNEVVT